MLRHLRPALARPAITLLLLTALSGGGFLFFAQTAHSQGGQTVSATVLKSADKSPQLDPTKLGEPLPRNLFVELSKLSAARSRSLK